MEVEDMNEDEVEDWSEWCEYWTQQCVLAGPLLEQWEYL